MAFEDWDKDEQGNVVVNPFTGMDTFIPVAMMCGVRIAYVTNAEMLDSGERHRLPLIMTPTQARDMASVLIKLAETAERPAPNETRQ